MKTPPEELFWRKVDKSGECWLWQASKDKDGYGMFAVTLPRDGLPKGVPTPQRRTRASRFAWETVNGPMPRGLYVLHSCDTPACVNPAHLRVGTQRDNYLDARAKGRHTHGERAGKGAILTEAKAREILLSAERVSATAERFGVSKATVYAIRQRRLWRHLDGAAR
jgi:hypothetical protein